MTGFIWRNCKYSIFSNLKRRPSYQKKKRIIKIIFLFFIKILPLFHMILLGLKFIIKEKTFTLSLSNSKFWIPPQLQCSNFFKKKNLKNREGKPSCQWGHLYLQRRIFMTKNLHNLHHLQEDLLCCAQKRKGSSNSKIKTF